MRRISTGVEQLLTTGAIADAVVSFALLLARAGTADTVSIPIVLENGTADEARLLLGPASQLTIVPDGAPEVDLPGADAVVADIQERMRRLDPFPVTDDDDQGGGQDPDFPDFDEYE